MAEEYVLTPGGFRPKSLVHAVEAGHVVHVEEGRIRTLDSHGKLVADHGPMVVQPGNGALHPHNVMKTAPGAAAKVPALGSGWITYAYWSNTTGKPITSFKTTWEVPPVPKTQSGQTIFFFNGIQNATMIYQPVLQWGPSAAGGGPSWEVASWYADGQTGHSFYSKLTPVKAGQVLVGVMTLVKQSGALFSYNCEFQGIANSVLPIQNVQELTWCAETLEAYALTKCSDYPAAPSTAMTGIAIQTGAVAPPLVWTADTPVHDCAQKTVVVSNSPTNGAVDLYY
jgi:hypothetical protein